MARCASWPNPAVLGWPALEKEEDRRRPKVQDRLARQLVTLAH
jgi:hypothetical protein